MKISDEEIQEVNDMIRDTVASIIRIFHENEYLAADETLAYLESIGFEADGWSEIDEEPEVPSGGPD